MSSLIDPDYEFDAAQYVDFSKPGFDEEDYGNEAEYQQWFDERAANPNYEKCNEMDLDAMNEPAAPAPACEQAKNMETEPQLETEQEQEQEQEQGIPLSVELAAPAMKTPQRPVSSSSSASAKEDTEQAVVSKLAKRANLRKGWGGAVRKEATNFKRTMPVRKSSKGPKQSVTSIAGTPTMLKRSMRRKKVETSEQLELQQIEEAKLAAHKLREKARKSYFLVKNKTAVDPETEIARSEKPLTIPEPFMFATDAVMEKREKKRPLSVRMRTRSSVRREKEIGTQSDAARPRTTVTKPFKFSKLQDPKHVASSGYVPMAAAVQDFQNRTPPRYHKPSAQQDRFAPSEKFELHTTVAMSPNITKPKEKRPQLTWEELQLEELKNIQPFKARPLNSAIMESESGQYGVPCVRPKECTVASSPAITKSRKVVPEPEHVPESEFHASKVPDFSKPFVPQLGGSKSKKLTQAAPFSERLYQDPRQSRDELARQEEEKLRKKREFRARPLKEDVQFQLKHDDHREIVPEPFSLRSEKIAQERKQQFIEKVEQISKEQKKQREFRSAPATVLEEAPYVPQKSTRPLTTTSNTQLHSEKRAKERAEFDAQLAKTHAEQEKRNKEMEEEAARAEQEAVARLRSQLVHKAQPVKKFKDVEHKTSEQRLTVPQSPASWAAKKKTLRM